MKKLLAFLLIFTMVFMNAAVYAEGGIPEKSSVKLYGYRIFDDDNSLYYGWVSFTADNPDTVTDEHPEPNADGDFTDMTCGAYFNNCVYGFAENGSFYRVNVSDWSRERLFGDSTSYNGWSDMTYDYTTGTLYAIAYTLPWESEEGSISASFLVKIDIYSYEITEIAQITTGILTLAADAEGQLYGIGMDGFLYSVDKNSGACLIIGSTGKAVNHAQSMHYDLNTDTMYWALCNQTQGTLCTVNLETGDAETIGVIGGNTEIVSLFVIPDNEPLVPVTGIEVNPKTASLNVGMTVSLTANVLPENASEKRYTWASSNDGAASVDADGTVHGNAAGTAVITAVSLEGGFTDSCTVTVNEAETVSAYHRVDTVEPDGDYLIVSEVEGQHYALVNRNGSPNGFAAVLVPVVLSPDGEYVLAPVNSDENMDNLLWTAAGDYTAGFSFQSVGNGLYFSALPYCNWTAISETPELWLPTEIQLDDGSEITAFYCPRALQEDPEETRLYLDAVTNYFDSVIYDFASLKNACNIEFYKFDEIPEPQYQLGDVNRDGAVNVTDAILTLRCAMGLITFDDEQLILADVDLNKTITIADAVIILRMAMELI